MKNLIRKRLAPKLSHFLGRTSHTQKNHLFKIILWIIFILYCSFALYLLFINQRRGTNLSIAKHLKYCCNFIPFKTIWEYIYRVTHNILNPGLAVRNLLGNMLLLTPITFLLPFLSQRFDSFKQSLKFSVVTILAIETAQLLLRVGSFDIDDFILNIPSGLLGYAVYKLTDSKRK